MKKIIFLLLFVLVALSMQAFETGKWYSLNCGDKALIIENASMANAAPLVLWTPTDVPSQLWQIEDNGDGTYSLKEGYMGEYLCTNGSAATGVKVVARTSGAKSRYGKWIFEAVEGKTDTYMILSKDGTYALSATETTDGIQPALVETNTLTGNCEWTIKVYDGEVQTEFNEIVRDDIIDDFMNHYYHTAKSGHILGNGGWWGDAEMFETILDAFETTGNLKYKTYWTELRKNFCSRNGTNWSNNTYNDDITWMVLACIRAYKYFGASNDLSYAKDNFDMMWKRGIEDSGSLRWNQTTENWYGSNSCINCPAINAACYLYEATGDEGYLDKAKALWDIEYEILCDHNDGHVWDSGSWDSSWTTFKCGNTWGSTYNQGTMLGACVNLYRLTGDEKYKDYADKVWNWTYKNLCSSNAAQQNIISACQTATGDLCGFKGILMRYCRLYAEEMNHEDVLQWMEKNAWFAYQNANSDGVIWSKWLTKTSEDYKSVEGENTKDFSDDAFGASTAVSVAFNAHVNRVFLKDAYSVLGAEMFDDIKEMQISNTFDDDGQTPNTTRTKGGYICFKNVDFGENDGATECNLRLYSASDGGNFTLYIDKICDETKIGSVDSMLKDWNNYNISITKTTGVHKVFVVSGAEIYTRFHTIQFANEANGIKNVMATKKDKALAIYNLNGQRLAKSQRGINIVGGKKVLTK